MCRCLPFERLQALEVRLVEPMARLRQRRGVGGLKRDLGPPMGGILEAALYQEQSRFIAAEDDMVNPLQALLARQWQQRAFEPCTLQRRFWAKARAERLEPGR